MAYTVPQSGGRPNFLPEFIRASGNRANKIVDNEQERLEEPEGEIGHLCLERKLYEY